MDYSQAKDIIKANNTKNFIIAEKTGIDQIATTQKRLFVNEPYIGEIPKYARKRGYIIRETQTAHWLTLTPVLANPKSEAENWEKSWRKAEKMLKISGLWTNLLKDIQMGLAVGYDTIQKANDIYWTDNSDKKIKTLDPRLIETNKDGAICANTGIIWRMSRPAKIKKMYFGKFRTADILAEFKDALTKKIKFNNGSNGSNSTGQSYDTTLEYNPDNNKAWYNEEYRHCGNGHYYLAIDATHALFSNDD